MQLRHALLTLLAVVALWPAQSQAQTRYAMYGIAFYNVENLFDTIHAPGKNDYDFLPGGMYRWNTVKYANKLKNVSRVLSELCISQHTPKGPAVIGLAEVENRAVVADLLAQPALSERGYRILHFESPDRRGIDCALLYNPRMFHLRDSLYVPYIYPSADNPTDQLGFTQAADGTITARPLFGDTTYITRGFLVGLGELRDEPFAFIVCHWPSRGAESIARERAGMQCKALIAALQKAHPGIKVILMGDLNDDPDNKSMTQAMACKYAPADVHQPTDIYDPWCYTLRTVGQGTLLYNGKWNLFDQIVMTGNVVDPKTKQKKSGKPAKLSHLNLKGGWTLYTNGVFCPAYLVQQEGRYKGSPLRTQAGGSWLNGYSDHFPTYVYLLKEVE